jgi:hypothetical protein
MYPTFSLQHTSSPISAVMLICIKNNNNHYLILFI